MRTAVFFTFVFVASFARPFAAGIPFDVQYVQTGAHCLAPLDTTLVGVAVSRNGLATFIPRNRSIDGGFKGEHFSGKLNKYTDSFFKTKFLVVLSLCENSGSIRHKIESVDNNGNITLLSIYPDIGTMEEMLIKD